MFYASRPVGNHKGCVYTNLVLEKKIGLPNCIIDSPESFVNVPFVLKPDYAIIVCLLGLGDWLVEKKTSTGVLTGNW
jgi:hypothetical protein